MSRANQRKKLLGNLVMPPITALGLGVQSVFKTVSEKVKKKADEVKKKADEIRNPLIKVNNIEDFYIEIEKLAKKDQELNEDYEYFIALMVGSFTGKQLKKKLRKEGLKFDINKKDQTPSWLSIVEKDIEKALKLYLKMVDDIYKKTNKRIVFSKKVSDDIVKRIYDSRAKELPSNPLEYQNSLRAFGRDAFSVENLIRAKPLKGKKVQTQIEKIMEKDKTSRANPKKFLANQGNTEAWKSDYERWKEEHYKEFGGGRKSRKRRRRTKKKKRRRKKKTRKKRKKRKRRRRTKKN